MIFSGVVNLWETQKKLLFNVSIFLKTMLVQAKHDLTNLS